MERLKKKLLFVLDSLTIGGAEKSLVSLLNLIDPSRYEVDLLLFKRGAALERYVPEHVRMLPAPDYFRLAAGEDVAGGGRALLTYHKVLTSARLRMNRLRRTPLHSEQVVFAGIRSALRPLPVRYDAAVAYSQGMPTYYVAHKVTAGRKIAWINTDYVNTQYDKALDYESYREFDAMVAVSEHTRQSVASLRGEYAARMHLIYDAVDPRLIRGLAGERPAEYDDGITNILTVGRLVTAKGYERAIDAARLLLAEGRRFRWYAIGEGPERAKLEALIARSGLEDVFMLLGAKVNPYPYMRHCDLYVQTSHKEGFGLTVCEAKILQRPVITTRFPTASEMLHDGVDGIIVDHDAYAVADAVRLLLDEPQRREAIERALRAQAAYDSTNELEKLYGLIEGGAAADAHIR